jgi:uncharacterized LabA/DUF88 family protein
MPRVAVFVDAGYLFAQGSKALTGNLQPRPLLRLNETAAISELRNVATTKAPGCDLLRIYWYDGTISFKGPTLDHERLANTDNIKLRLGFINSSGQQKGVDSLIVTDLIDLARNHALTDGVLLSGDEDVRIGVQIAQQFGVRVHLVGITPSIGSQAKTLCQESDTTTEWDGPTVAKFLTVVPAPAVNPAKLATARPTAVSELPSGHPATLTADVEKVIVEFAATLDVSQKTQLKSHWKQSAGVPPEFDGRLLARSRAILARDLTAEEKRLVRAKFRQLIEQ